MPWPTSHLRKLRPDQEETVPKADAPKAETPKAEAPRLRPKGRGSEGARRRRRKPEAPRFPGKLMIMSPGDRAWDDSAAAKAQVEEKTATSGKRRVAAMAAVVVLATAAGALGGALATAGLGHFVAGDDQASAKSSALEASVARIDADMIALKASVEHTAKIGMSQFNKASDRLDKVEKAQAEPAAKLAKLSEAVDKLRTTPRAPLRLPRSRPPPRMSPEPSRRPKSAGCRRSTAGCCAMCRTAEH